MEEAKETKVEEEQVWACFANPQLPDEGPWYALTKSGVVALADPPSPMTLTDAKTVGSQLGSYVKVVRHPAHPFDRTILEAIVREELSAPLGVAQPLWTRWVLSLFELALTTDEPEFKDTTLFKEALRYMRENPDTLNWFAPLAA